MFRWLSMSDHTRIALISAASILALGLLMLALGGCAETMVAKCAMVSNLRCGQ
jgi:hypothetical protein